MLPKTEYTESAERQSALRFTFWVNLLPLTRDFPSEIVLEGIIIPNKILSMYLSLHSCRLVNRASYFAAFLNDAKSALFAILFKVSLYDEGGIRVQWQTGDIVAFCA